MASLIGGNETTSRLKNSTMIDQVDDGVRFLEQDLSKIFGVPLNTTISAPIFSKLGIGAVANDGTINGELRFSSDYTGNPASSPGVTWESQASSDKWKLSANFSNLTLYEWNTDTELWEALININEIADSLNTFKGLDDVIEPSGGWVPANALKYLRLDATGESVEAVDLVPASGAEVLSELNDVPAYEIGGGDGNKVLAVELGLNPQTYWRDMPSGTVLAFTELTDVYGSIGGGDPLDVSQSGSNVIIGLVSGDPKVLFDENIVGMSDPTSWKIGLTDENPGTSASGAFLISAIEHGWNEYGPSRYIYMTLQPNSQTNYNFWERAGSSPTHWHCNFPKDGVYRVDISGNLMGLTHGKLKFTINPEIPSMVKPLLSGNVLGVLYPPIYLNDAGTVVYESYVDFNFSTTVTVRSTGDFYHTGSATTNNGQLALRYQYSQDHAGGNNMILSNFTMAVTRIASVAV